MMLYLVLKYIHIFAAIVMVGISLSNGAGKMFADRTGNVHRITSVMATTVFFNKVLVLPSLVMLALSGIGLAAYSNLPLLSGWVFQAIILLAILFFLFFVGNHYERRLHRIAEGSENNKEQTVPDNYWKVTRTYMIAGFSVLAAVFLSLYLMIFQKSLF